MPCLSRTARLLSVGLIALPFLAAVSTNVNAQSPSDFVGVTDAMLENPAPGDWLTWRRTPDGWGYSPLDQIDRDWSCPSYAELRIAGAMRSSGLC